MKKLRKITVKYSDGKPSWKYYIYRKYHGKCQFFHINGGIQWSGQYFNGRMFGTWIGYCLKGKIFTIYNRSKINTSDHGVTITFN